MKILAIDPGTDCGYAYHGKELIHGAWSFKAERPGLRYLLVRRTFEHMFENAIDCVGYEYVLGHRGVIAAHVYGGIVAELLIQCELTGIKEICPVPVKTLKKFATNNGNASKELMITCALQHFDFHPTVISKHGKISDDEADAYLLLKYIEHEKKVLR